ncbi:ABC transporter substrate-binding protein [Streptomyces rapamycinicus NRRL 5491]|uniref:ABC transporter substrate-binding protein n=2 Tax=Streptomyces rapamycinicus TaxID=1226757 RepID=A0A0A0NJR5_STRRN|nr:ABC transporter substrate-binding protein [Streptomyces rapamycinicus NRRL 5491]MBB4789031.1 iron complex transport system substrate-binding protein [Streptomyces rapamycinicus]RLV77001.1 ABC transporter substrate-binding protein [Streptomyces rapamycinicus NRRL 5491]
MLRSARRTAALLLAPALLLTACGGSGHDDADPGRAAGSGYPRTIDNCGHKVTLKSAPKRALSLNQGTTEILLSLGLADRMAATATWTDPVMKGLEKANARVERLADNAPSFEKSLDAEPDFVTASFVSTLGKGGVATREQFEKLGVPTYVSPSDCAAGRDTESGGDGARGKPLTLDVVYGEIRDLAHAFGVDERGEKLVARLRERVRKATDGVDASGVSLMYWFANSQSPYLAGCCGAPGAITRAVGAENAFSDTHDEWPQINWETVADRDPDVIVLGDLTRKQQTAETARAKMRFLETNAATRNLTAVKKKRYILLSGQAMNPSLRTVEGVEQVAAGLRDFGLAK